MTDKEIDILLKRYFDNKCSSKELEQINDWYNKLGQNIPSVIPDEVYQDIPAYKKRSFELILNKIEVKKSRRRRKLIYALAAAAAVLVFAMAGTWAYYNHLKPGLTSNALAAFHPGHSGALLTLSDGKTVLLDSTANGTIASLNNVEIANSNGQLQYSGSKTNGDHSESGADNLYNTLATQKGRQYRLVLPDGSKVWLNSASSLRYPVAFSKDKREVQLTGEAYFEVRHNAKAPFVVKAGATEITDLGTHFNVYAYPDEAAIKTTLLEGAVKVGGRILTPGQQALISTGNTVKVIDLENPENAVAWKNGLINFTNTDFYTLMRQIGRWYDVDIRIKGDLSKYHLTGTIPKNMELAQVLELLNTYGLQFKLLPNKRILIVSDQ